MRIDSHQHFWNYDPARDSWITLEMPVLRRDYLPQDLLPELRLHGVDACVAVQADQSERETEFLLQLAGCNPEIIGVVGWVDLRSPAVGDSLRRFAEYEKFCGVRHIVQGEGDDRFMLQESFMRGIACLREFDLTYDILVYPRQLPAAIELARRFPEQRFVLDHIAKPEIRVDKREPWATHIRELATCRNVYCKISGLVTEADWQRWSAADIFPYLDVVFEAFGTSRLMFGSDWPVCLLAGTYERVVGLVSEYTSSLPENERTQIFGVNAVRFYGLQGIHEFTARQ
ncbi:MAG TPA: amidohydrolase family protein [Terriglobales bacterium]|nr:amidohydrolase family protein [Terriglobales bacterium]